MIADFIIKVKPSHKRDLVPVGTVMAWFSDAEPPSTWASCRGQCLFRGDYPELFVVIAKPRSSLRNWIRRHIFRREPVYTYGGSGDYFNLPDLRAKVTNADSLVTRIGEYG